MSSISNYCIIRDGRLILNDAIIYQSEEVDIDSFLESLYDTLELSYPKFYKMDRLAKLGIIGCECLLKELKQKNISNDISIILANKHSSLDTDNKFRKSMNDIPSPALFVYTLPNIVNGELAIRYNIQGETIFFIQDEFDASFFLNYTEYIFEMGKAKYCLCGWIDVMNNNYNVFLYLITISQLDKARYKHTIEELNNLYHNGTFNE